MQRKYGFIFSLCLFFFINISTSCNPIKQLQRLQKNHSYLFEKSQRDSIVFTKGFKNDTFFYFSKISEKDTFFIETTNTIIKRSKDTLFVSQKVLPCTTFIRTNTIQPLPNKRQDKRQIDFMGFLLFGFLIIGLLTLFFVIKKWMKK